MIVPCILLVFSQLLLGCRNIPDYLASYLVDYFTAGYFDLVRYIHLQVKTLQIIFAFNLAVWIQSIFFPFAFRPYLRLTEFLVSLHFLVFVVHVIPEVLDISIFLLLFVFEEGLLFIFPFNLYLLLHFLLLLLPPFCCLDDHVLSSLFILEEFLGYLWRCFIPLAHSMLEIIKFWKKKVNLNE